MKTIADVQIIITGIDWKLKDIMEALHYKFNEGDVDQFESEKHKFKKNPHSLCNKENSFTEVDGKQILFQYVDNLNDSGLTKLQYKCDPLWSNFFVDFPLKIISSLSTRCRKNIGVFYYKFNNDSGFKIEIKQIHLIIIMLYFLTEIPLFIKQNSTICLRVDFKLTIMLFACRYKFCNSF
jgi:hypothetical protein